MKWLSGKYRYKILKKDEWSFVLYEKIFFGWKPLEASEQCESLEQFYTRCRRLVFFQEIKMPI